MASQAMPYFSSTGTLLLLLLTISMSTCSRAAAVATVQQKQSSHPQQQLQQQQQPEGIQALEDLLLLAAAIDNGDGAAIAAAATQTAGAAAAAVLPPVVRYRTCGTRHITAEQHARIEGNIRRRLIQLNKSANGTTSGMNSSTSTVKAGVNSTVNSTVNYNRQVYEVPVYFHVVLLVNNTLPGINSSSSSSSNGSSSSKQPPPIGMVTQSQIAQQIGTLNMAYNGSFKFKLAGAWRHEITNLQQFTSDEQTPGEKALKSQFKKSGNLSSLNIYTWAPIGIWDKARRLGYSTYPWDAAKDPVRDGVVLSYDVISGGSRVGYNMGKTAVHEIGHWLGLFHTFQGGCSPIATGGDRVTDTPAVKTANTLCVQIDSCPQLPGEDLIHNYMDYTPDACMNSFTPGQRARMADMWRLHRLGR